ncbi:MAG: hypothetical protein JRJ59_12310 [Deltaproteobacteria bacterium]|nr:hypothetical protein [Deltaproteobacteria bacterium]
MSLSLETTVCSAEANSYTDLDTAAAYFEADPNLAQVWAGLEDEERMRLLIGASRAINRVRWKSSPLAQAAFKDFGLSQALAFPRAYHPYRYGLAGSGSATTLTDSSLADQPAWPDDLFNGGAVLMTSGQNQGLIRAVTEFTSATGQLTLTAFPQAVAAGDAYFLIWPLEEVVVMACLEQAGHLISAGPDGLADLGARGVSSASVDGLSLSFDGRPVTELCARARTLLKSHWPRGVKLERG